MNKPEFNKKENFITSRAIKTVFPAQFRKWKNQLIIIESVEAYLKKSQDFSFSIGTLILNTQINSSCFFDSIHLNPKGQVIITKELIQRLNRTNY